MKLFNRIEVDHTMVNYIIATLVMIIVALVITACAVEATNGLLMNEVEAQKTMIQELQQRILEISK